jgi:hypothetical protein
MANQADHADQGTDLRPANPVMPRRQPGANPCQCMRGAALACGHPAVVRTMCGSRTGGWSLPGVMSD